MDTTLNLNRLINCNPQGKMLKGLVYHDTKDSRWIEPIPKCDEVLIKNDRIEIPENVSDIHRWFADVILEFVPQQYLFEEANRLISGAATNLRKKYFSLISNLSLDEWPEFSFLNTGEVHTEYEIREEEQTVVFKWMDFRTWYNCKEERFMGVGAPYYDMFALIKAHEKMIEYLEQFVEEFKEESGIKECKFEINYTNFMVNLIVKYEGCTALHQIFPHSYRKDLVTVHRVYSQIVGTD